MSEIIAAIRDKMAATGLIVARVALNVSVRRMTAMTGPYFCCQADSCLRFCSCRRLAQMKTTTLTPNITNHPVVYMKLSFPHGVTIYRLQTASPSLFRSGGVLLVKAAACSRSLGEKRPAFFS